MLLSYYSHSCFKLKGKRGTVLTDPYSSYVGFSLPTVSADIVTVSHDHPDHNAVGQVGGTARRPKPFLITQPGEYEVGGISVFSTPTFHDASQGAERGANLVHTILIDDVRVCHLGDLGHELSAEQIEAIGSIDVLLCPVGGTFTIDAAMAVKVIHSLEPSIVIPMHYKTERHKQDVFADLHTLDAFLTEYGGDKQVLESIDLVKTKLPEETELVVLREQVT